MEKSGNPMTMKEIASELNISVATVSRALKNNHHISKEVRDKVQAFAKDHSFTPNVIATSLRNSRKLPTKLIGVIVPQFTHYYFSSVLSGIDKEARSMGYTLIVAQSEEEYENEVAICKHFYDQKVCGIIVSQAKDTTCYDHFRFLIDAGVPLVFYDRICTGVDASRVVVDDYQGTFNAVSYLIETGCRNIAFFGAPKNLEISKNRFNGYRDALLKNKLGINENFIRVCDNKDDAERVAREMLEQECVPDAFFAVNDDTAIGIMKVAKSMGYRIPRDISVCGFTNGFEATACDPMLTTVEQRGIEVGRQAVSLLINKVEGKLPKNSVEKRVVKTRLVTRESTR